VRPHRLCSGFRTDLKEFLLDCLDFIERKVHDACADATSQKGAMIEAGGVGPLMAERLRAEDPTKFASVLLVAEDLLNTLLCERLSNMDRDEFLRAAGRA
jgi:hypothetical protein